MQSELQKRVLAGAALVLHLGTQNLKLSLLDIYFRYAHVLCTFDRLHNPNNKFFVILCLFWLLQKSFLLTSGFASYAALIWVLFTYLFMNFVKILHKVSHSQCIMFSDVSLTLDLSLQLSFFNFSFHSHPILSNCPSKLLLTFLVFNFSFSIPISPVFQTLVLSISSIRSSMFTSM